ncbi:MAG: translation initiation factor IF-2 N-terminal domain-containing protein, partial [Cyclobacteriaceae bacterium]|nr:translation initiation factor IF-2 N-terminal domain-containing protein [Cyclobacteriaceae bacterium]
MYRLSQVARKLNVGSTSIIDFLTAKGFEVDTSPNSKITEEQFALLSKEFASSAMDKEEASGLTIGGKVADNTIIKANQVLEDDDKGSDDEQILIKDNAAPPVHETKKEVPVADAAELIARPKLEGPKVLGKIDLDAPRKPKVQSPAPAEPEPIPEPVREAEPIPEPVMEKQKEEPVPVPEAREEKKESQPKPEKIKEPAPELPAPEKVEAKEAEKPEVVEAAPQETKEKPKAEIRRAEAEKPVEDKPKSELIEAKAESLKGLTVLGKIELPTERKKEKPVASSDERKDRKKRPRKRIPNSPASSTPPAAGQGKSPLTGQKGPKRTDVRPARGGRDTRKTEDLTDKEIQDKIKATLAKLSGGGGKAATQNRSKYRRDKRFAKAEQEEEKFLKEQDDLKKLRVTEFISANDLASLLDISVNEVISKCLALGMFVSINQRLDAESITIIADEFGYDVEFTTADDETEVEEADDNAEDLKPRAPIVTIMGHVDHGKTSLLDYIRHSKVTEGEAGGITQHIGAYDVMTKDNKRIAFLDTPGHEAFTAMRARGAKITDVIIIVVAADDAVMPQTKEAINHAQVAGVPIVIAINKVDKPNANPEKIKEELSQINILVEDWGGKYQCQHISAKTGEGVDELLEKVLLEAELLDLHANPDKPAIGSVIEASLDKGRGYVTTLMVQSGTLR